MYASIKLLSYLRLCIKHKRCGDAVLVRLFSEPFKATGQSQLIKHVTQNGSDLFRFKPN